jgi:hypothetical protein
LYSVSTFETIYLENTDALPMIKIQTASVQKTGTKYCRKKNAQQQATIKHP